MAWHEQGPSGNYFICLRVGEKRFQLAIPNRGVKPLRGR